MLLLLLLGFAACAQIQFTIYNILDPAYANPNYLPPEAAPFQDRVVRRQQIIGAVLEPMSETSQVFMFQEISVDSPCLSNSSITIEGEYKYIAGAMNELGYTCYHVTHAHDGTLQGTYWGKYFDFESCTAFNAYVQSGNAICLANNSFSNIEFFDVALTTGSHIAVANVTYQGQNLRLGSIHFDSDVGGNRNREVKELFQLFPAGGSRLNFFGGDYNSAWEPGPLWQDYVRSGYISGLLSLSNSLMQPEINSRSQPLTRGWYNTPIHFSAIDHCLGEKYRATPSSALWRVNASKYGYPGFTINGVMANQLWARIPELPGNDINEPARVIATLVEQGSDHYPIVSTWFI